MSVALIFTGDIMGDFQHFKSDDDFPYNARNVYAQYENNFDYDDYTGAVTLRPCNVKWTPASGDRPYWKTTTERDAWFASHAPKTWELSTLMQPIDGKPVKLPIPWQALRYANYLEMTIPGLPNAIDQYDYATPHVSRTHWWITGMRRVSGSVTECTLLADNWTTWLPETTIARINVQRGHVAMTHTTVEKYLADPIANVMGLTGAEPIAPANPTNVKSNAFVPLATGDLVALLAMRCTFDALETLKMVSQPAASTMPVFSDSADEWGHGYNVADYVWGGVSGNGETPLSQTVAPDNVRPTGYSIVSVQASQLGTALNSWESSMPQIFALIEACYVVPASMVAFGDSITLQGIQVTSVMPANETKIVDVNLAKAMFAYPERYENLTKLYTAPYSWLEINDGHGNKATVMIEDTGTDLGVVRRVSLAYPYIKLETFITGVGGGENIDYEWRDMINAKRTSTISASAYAALMSHDVPSYQLMISGATEWALNNGSSAVEQARQNALNAYHVSQRNANVGELNTDASATTGNANTQRSTATMVANAKVQTDNNSAVTTRNNKLMLDSKDLAKAKLNADYTVNHTKLVNDALADYSYAGLLHNADVDTNAMAAVGSIVSGAAATAIGVGVTIATGGAGVLAAGVIGSSTTGAVSAGYSGYSSALAISKSDSILNANQANINAKAQLSETAMSGLTTNANDNLENNYLTQSAANVDLTDLRNTAATETTGNNAGTANANSAASTATTIANANRSNDATTFANQTALIQAQEIHNAKIADLERSKSINATNASGDATLDMWGNNGVQVRVMTQNADVIKRCGDDMLLHGYVYNETVEQPKLDIMTNFTYWQGTPTLYGDMPLEAYTDIATTLENGVTIWPEPDNIGNSIYDNEIKA